MKEAVTKVVDTLTQNDFHGAFKQLLERYNKCIVAGGDYIEGDEFHVCTINKVSLRKKSGNSSYTPRTMSWAVKTDWSLFLSITHNKWSRNWKTSFLYKTFVMGSF